MAKIQELQPDIHANKVAELSNADGKGISLLISWDSNTGCYWRKYDDPAKNIHTWELPRPISYRLWDEVLLDMSEEIATSDQWYTHSPSGE